MSLDFMGFPNYGDMTDQQRQENEASVARAVAAIEGREFDPVEDVEEEHECRHPFCPSVISDIRDGMCSCQREKRQMEILEKIARSISKMVHLEEFSFDLVVDLMDDDLVYIQEGDYLYATAGGRAVLEAYKIRNESEMNDER